MSWAEAATAIFGTLGFLAFFYGNEIYIVLRLREIRKMAASLPEADHECWLNDALSAMGDTLGEEMIKAGHRAG